MEEWKSIIDFDDYEISSLGNIRSQNYILKSNLQSSGYLRVNLYKNKKPYSHLIHRLVALAFIENPKNLPEIDHLDRNKTNNNITNLRWCSRSENNINKLYKSKSAIRNIRQRTENSWEVKIYRNRKLSFYKYCKSLEEALKARDEFLISLNLS